MENIPDTHERNHTFDTLRVIAAFLVIILHVSAGFVLGNLSDRNHAFWIGNLYNSFARVSVPLFILISGYFLIGRDATPAVFYKKRWNKLFVPFVFWSAFYLLYTFVLMYMHHEVDIVLLGKYLGLGIPAYHLWFLFLLIGLYVVTPIINRYLAERGSSALYRWGIYLLLFGVFLDLWDTYFQNQQFFGLWGIKYVGYFILGYALPQQAWVKKITLLKRTVFVAGYVLGSTGIAVATFLTIPYLYKNLYFYTFLNPFAVLASLSLYLFFVQIRLKENVLSRLSPLTLGIYAVHVLILDRLLVLSSHWAHVSPLVSIPLLSVVIFASSTLLTLLIRQVPYLKKTV